MRQVTLAKSAGFCFGVKRAVNKVYEEAKKGRVYTYGPIIHNEEVVKDLENKGVKVINRLEEFQDIPEGTVVIRSHGVAKEVYDFLKKQDLKIVDATCPFVLKIHRIVEEHAKAGEHIVIIGNDKHPEAKQSRTGTVSLRQRITGASGHQSAGRQWAGFFARAESRRPGAPGDFADCQ